MASFTHPFTLGADVITAIPIAAVFFAESARLVRTRGATSPSQVPTRGARRFIPWIALSVAVIGFELFNYAEEPRRAHPTLSSLSDELTRWPAGRAALFLAWLALGAFLLTRAPLSTRARDRES
jgi:hypothetical protein